MHHGHWLLKLVSGIDIAASEFKVHARIHTRHVFDAGNMVVDNDAL